MNINAETKLYGVLKWPLTHTSSPTMHNAAFASLGINSLYVPFAVKPENIASGLQGLLDAGLQGGNVTVPHKESVANLVSRLEGDAAKLRTVNTLVREGDKFVGHTTDGAGFLRALIDHKVDPSGMSIVMLGAGGAARSIGIALMGIGVKKLTIVNRTEAKAKLLAEELGEPATAGGIDAVSEADLFVNATSVGTSAAELPDELKPVVDKLTDKQVVMDIVYLPVNTVFLEKAGERGAQTINGLSMLLHQAALSFELWTGQPAPLEIMRSALTEFSGK